MRLWTFNSGSFACEAAEKQRTGLDFILLAAFLMLSGVLTEHTSEYKPQRMISHMLTENHIIVNVIAVCNDRGKRKPHPLITTLSSNFLKNQIDYA